MMASNIKFFLGASVGVVLQMLKSLQHGRIINRIWNADHTVWKSEPDNIINRLDWLNAPADTLAQLSYIHSVLNPVIAEGYNNAVLLGMGGSSLAAEVFAKLLGCRTGHPQLRILDTTDPSTISRIAQEIDWSRTLFLISSKSGTTLETISLFHYFYNLMLKKIGKKANRNFIVITDPGSPLEALANRIPLRHVFLSNSAIGGRYSALSFPGIVPAALLGIDVGRILKNALAIAQNERNELLNGKLNASGSVLGAAIGTLAQKGRNKITFILPPSWAPLGCWLEQLIAESTGKEGQGILPVDAETLTVPAAYNDDRLFIVFHSKENLNSPKVSALIAAGHPVITIRMQSKFHLGGQMFLWEMATAVASHILCVNPFDQPDVETSKVLTRRMIDLYRGKRELPKEEAALTTPEYSVYGCKRVTTPGVALADFLATAKDDAYVCLQVYLSPTPKIDTQLRKLRSVISKKYHRAAIINHGPRYLHSTGQLHKGDAGQGLFIQLTSADIQDLEIPDQLGISGSTLTFGALKSAQALGDRQALIKLGRKVLRIHFNKNISESIEALTLTLLRGCNRGHDH